MDYNYHTHTYHCSHATGSIEDYIKRAISSGIKYMGFSDHMPYICRDGFESGFRVPFSQGKAYFDEIDELRKKYLGQINIKIGFEMEYYPSQFDKMLESAINFGAEYLILGPHFVKEESPDGVHAVVATDCVSELNEYVACVIEGIKSGVFTYIAHPDMFNFTGNKEIYKQEMRKICIAAKNFNVPLEINFMGIRENRIYPNELFWQMAGEEKTPVTFGFDAHNAESAFDDASLKKAMAIVKKFDLNYIGRPNLVLLN